MSHVFVSYSHKDGTFARQLVDSLQAAGLAVWFDKDSIQPGDNWDQAIEEGLRTAIAVVIIISPDSMASKNVRNEVNFALDNDQLLLPVLYRPAQVILNLESIQWVDLSTPELYTANFPNLVARIAKATPLLPDNVLPPGFKTPPPDASVFSGVEIEVGQDRLTVTNDSRELSTTQLRRYLRALAVIASPLDVTPPASNGQNGPPRLDINLAWRNLANAIVTAHQLPGGDDNVPFALVRLAPPTVTNLDRALHIDGADGYQIVHLLAHSQAAELYLETEEGLANRLNADRLVSLFEGSQARLVVTDGPLDETLVEALLTRTPVQAVIDAEQRVGDSSALLFNGRFYGRLAAGEGVQAAFDTVIQGLAASAPTVAQGYRLHLPAGVDEVVLEQPIAEQRATKPLIDPGLPRLRNVPVNLGFVGRRQALQAIQAEISNPVARQLAIYGLGGIGKSWLAAEYITRFGWRYPDGILWMHVSEQTKSEDVLGQLLALLELPASTSPGDLRVALRNRQVLVVLDQANEWNEPLEIGELTDFLARLDTVGGTRFMLTSWSALEPLTHTSGTRRYVLEEMPPPEAARLARRLIDSHDLQAEFDQVENGFDQFVERTLHTPWLIAQGIELVSLDGLAAALEDLEALASEDVTDVLARYIGRQIDMLNAERAATGQFLQKLQGLPDSFDRSLAQALGGDGTRQHLRELLRHNLLRRENNRYSLPATVRAYLRQYMPLPEEEQDRIDAIILKHMLEKSAAQPLLA